MPELPSTRIRTESQTEPVASAAGTIWLPAPTILIAIALVVLAAAGLWMLYMLQGMIFLVLLALFFAYLIAPLVDLVQGSITTYVGRPLPRAAAIGLVYLLLLGSIGLLGYLLLPRLGVQITAFGQQAPSYVAAARGRLEAWRYFVNPDNFPPSVRAAVERTMTRSAELMGGYVSYGLTSLLELLGYLPWFVLIPILAFFLLKDAEEFRRDALLALPYGRLRGSGASLFEDINDALAAYIRAGLLACLLIGAVCTVVFVIIGVPYALLLGVFAGLMEFIPLVGPLIVAVSAAVVAGFHSIGQAFAVLLVLGILRIAQDYVIYPRLIGHGIHMHPLAVILAILCGAELAGIAGIFLAIPVVAVLSAVYRNWLRYRGTQGLVADLLKPPAPVAVVPTSDMGQTTGSGLAAAADRRSSAPPVPDPGASWR
jgi:predicted PurR-regulated permease PerM